MDRIAFNQLPDLFTSVGELFTEKKEELCDMDARLGGWRPGAYHE